MYSLPQIIISVTLLILGFFILSRNSKQATNRVFFFLSLVTCVWLFAYGIAYRQVDKTVAAFWLKIGYTSIAFICVAGLHCTIEVLKIKSLKKIISLFYLFSVLFSFLIWKTNYIVKDFILYFWGYYPIAGFFHPVFLIFFIGSVSYACILLASFLLFKNKKLTPSERTQIKYVLLAFTIYSSASVDFFPNYGIIIYPFGYLFGALYIAIISYSIVRHHLMDIEILVKKTTFISIGAIIPVALLYIALSYIQPILSPKLGPAWLTVPVLLSALIAFALFRFIKFILRMNESDLSKKFAYRPMLEKEAERTARARDVREMATFIVRDVSSFTRLDHTAVFILNDQKNAYALMASVYRKKDRPKLEPGLLLSIHSPLVAYLKDEKKPAVYGQIMHDLQNKDLTSHERKFLESVESELAILGAEICVPSFCEDELIGIMNLGNKITNEIFTGQDLQAFQTLANQTGRAISGLLLKTEKIRLIVSSQKSLLETLEARDHYTRGHTERVSQYSMLLGHKLERLIHSIPNSISALNWTAQLHDLGKVGISDNILLKPSALNDEEFAKIKEHPTRGIEILGPLKEWFGEDIIQGVVHHHENYDGSGYPDKQKGDIIHIFARIIRVADAFDAMTTDRPYRKGLSIEEAMAEIKKFRKVQFDPVVADAFIELYQEGILKKIMDELKAKFG